MLKLVLFIVGLVAGAGGAISWLLSEPERGNTRTLPESPASVQGRLTEVRSRWNESIFDGKRQRDATEQRLRQELDSYRAAGGRPANAG